MIKEYSKGYVKNFLQKAEKFLDIAQQNIEKYPEEAAFNATQAIINANDALTVFMLGKRATKDHREAILLHKEVVKKVGDSSKLPIVQTSLEYRDAAGYDVKKSMGKKDCRTLLKRAERFIDWTRRLIK